MPTPWQQVGNPTNIFYIPRYSLPKKASQCELLLFSCYDVFYTIAPKSNPTKRCAGYSRYKSKHLANYSSNCSFVSMALCLNQADDPVQLLLQPSSCLHSAGGRGVYVLSSNSKCIDLSFWQPTNPSMLAHSQKVVV